jgi:UDP-GlcNAc:undecaprenyl-phosphate GlcNAc-1-phosphate transferase
MMTVVSAFLSFVITVVFMLALRPLALAVGLVDIPGGRKRHGFPAPTIGGIAMGIGLGVGTALIEYPEFWTPTLLGVYVLVVVGTIDDRFDLPANVRLIAQTCAALLVLASGIRVTDLGEPLFFTLDLGAASVPFTLLFIVTIVNAFNIIDGIDGLAGGLSMLSLVAMTIIGIGTPAFALAAVAAAVVAAYLLFNMPFRFNKPVRTFMGDAGSTSLGLIIATIGIHLSQEPVSRISPVVGLWLVAVPVFDLFSTIVRRLLQGRSPFAPDHEHLHHVLTSAGLSRPATLVCMLTLAAVFVACGLLGDVFAVPDGALLLGWLLAGVFYYWMVRHPSLVVRFVRGVLPKHAKPTAQTPETPYAGEPD